MALVDLETVLAAPAPSGWRAVKTVAGWVFLFGVIPFSRHTLHVQRIDDAAMTLSSREGGGFLRRWNHDIIVTATGNSRCNYRDRIDIDAGVFTPLVVLYARWFYRTRQRRWRALARVLAVEGPT